MHSNLLFNRIVLLACLLLPFITPLAAQDLAQRTKNILERDSRIKQFTINEKTGTIASLYFRERAGLKATDAGTIIRSYFELGPRSNEIRREQQIQLPGGIQVERFRLYFHSIPVEHSSYAITSRNGEIISLNAESYQLPESFVVSPSLNDQQALEKAVGFVNAKKYMWEALKEDKVKAAGNSALQQKLEQLIQEHSPTGKLVIISDVYGNKQPRLAWKFDIYAAEPLGRYNIYIDAADGHLLLRDMIIKHANEEKKPSDPVKIVNTGEIPFLPTATKIPSWKYSPPRITSEAGTAHTRYAGIRTIQTTRVSVPLLGMPDPNNPSVLLSYSGVDPRAPIVLAEQVFILKDDTRGNGIETYDMNGIGGAPLSLPGLHAQSLAFVDRDVLAGSQNVWKNEAAGTNEDHIRGATSDGSTGADEGTNDDFALDAHWGAEVVYDYWKNVHNRFSFDNRNSAIKSYVHYGPAYDNAFWNGSVMTYGDGSGTTALGFKPLTSLDVCGHEIGHGVCSYTSDLVYESESGAMNEAFSDIWAASIERYAILNIDPSLLAVYKPFSIGEQISVNPNNPLRRMDNPKLKSDPDTYGGQYWVNPNCVPTLANDQCGVHTNSGVLNKWFYLLTVGSTTGSGPDASYAVPGSDDGLRDAPGVPNGGGPYNVTGIGFNKSEAIAYLAETLLTPNATFADARVAAITAARILFGECSAEEISVTNAWYAVGVGAAYTTCTLPVISAYAGITDVLETAGGLDCIRFNEYNINVNLTVAQASATTVNFAIGTTTLSADEYSLSTTSVIYTAGQTGLRTVKLRIYDDAMVETDETIQVLVTCSSPVLNQSIVFTVRNDDFDPLLGGVQTLLNENFESVPEGPYATPGSTSVWGKVDKIAPSPVNWSVRTDGPVPTPLSFPGKRAIIEMPALTGEALYDQLAEANTILRTPLINATGLNSVRVQFTYQAGGEPACEPACDYGRLMYSFDGINFSAFFDLDPLFLSFTDASFDFTLPASFNGKQFYLGMQWYNDANAGTSGSVTIDDFIVTAKGRAIESELGDAVSEKVNAETGKPSYFYSTADGEIISRISNSASNNYGCVTNFIEKAGVSGFILYQNGIHVHRVADKVIRVNAATNPSGNYNISFYFTEQEIAGIESFAGNTRFNMFIYKTSASAYTGAAQNNTNRVTATYTPIPGLGGRFSANFTNGFNGSYALGTSIQGIPLPVTCVDFKAIKANNRVELTWIVNEERDNGGFEVERSTDGVHYSSIGRVDANPAAMGNYGFTDQHTAGTRDVYYRLKQVDLDGEYHYICTILRLRLDAGTFSLGNIYPNPGRSGAFVNVYTEKPMQLRIDLINASGQRTGTQTELLQSGATRVNLKWGNQPAGIYIVQFRNENGELLGTQRYTKTR